MKPSQILLNTLDVGKCWLPWCCSHDPSAIVCIGLIWDSDQPTVKIIQLLSDTIGLQIKLDHVSYFSQDLYS